MIYTEPLPEYMNIYIRIRPFVKEDMTEEYAKWLEDPEVTRFNSWGLFPYTKEQQEAFIKDLEGSSTKIVWAIEKLGLDMESCFDTGGRLLQVKAAKTTYTHIGNCSLQRIDYINRSAEFAVVIGNKDYWRKGICTIVLNTVLKHAFRSLGMNRVWTGTAATNWGMQKAAVNCGFRREGTYRQGIFLQGKFQDIYAYGILAEDYFKRIQHIHV